METRCEVQVTVATLEAPTFLGAIGVIGSVAEAVSDDQVITASHPDCRQADKVCPAACGASDHCVATGLTYALDIGEK